MELVAQKTFEFEIGSARYDTRPSVGAVLFVDGTLSSADRVIQLELSRQGCPLVKAELYDAGEQQIFRACLPLGVIGATDPAVPVPIIGRATLSSGEQYTYFTSSGPLSESQGGDRHPLLEPEVFPPATGTAFAQQELGRLLPELREGVSFKEQLDDDGKSMLSVERLLEHIRQVSSRGSFASRGPAPETSDAWAAIPSYYDLVERSAPGRCTARVCIVTSDLVGPTFNGGMGTFCTSLAETLAQAGAEVEILFVPGTRCEKGTFDEWVEVYAKKGIRLCALPFEHLPFKGNGLRSRSYEVYRWLSQSQYDVIHFHDMVGFGYYSTLAKKCGLAFEASRLCVEVHSPHRWHWHHDSRFFEAESDLEMDYMERRSIECADTVLGPSAYLLNWVREQGWRLPEESYVLPYPLADHLYSAPQPRQGAAVQEIVFFGRLEKRKGLPFFCDVLDALHEQGLLQIPVSFLGKERDIDGMSSVEYIQLRASQWSVPVSVETELSHHDGLAYLQHNSRLAVLASRSDNSPFTVYECIALGIPFVASAVGGIPELIAAEDKERTLFPLEVDKAAQQLARALKTPARSVRPRYDPKRVRAAWVELHTEALVSDNHRAPLYQSERDFDVSDVEIVIDGRGVETSHLEELYASLGFAHEISIALLRDVEDRECLLGRGEGQRQCSVSRSQGQSAAEVYNGVLETSDKELLLFVDGRDVLAPDAISTMLSARAMTSSSLLSSMAEHFVDDVHALTSIELPLGPLGTVQCLRNVFGTSMLLIERRFLLSIGGFCPTPTREASIRELYSRAVLLHPQSCCFIPKPLLRRRYGEQSLVADEFTSRMIGLKPAFNASQQWVREILLLVQGLAIRVGENPNLEQHANPQVDWNPEKFHASDTMISLPKNNLAMHCTFEDCNATSVAEGMQIYVDGPVGFVYLPMTLIPRCTFVALSLSIEVAADCEIFLEILRDGQHTFNTHSRVQIPLHQGRNQIYRTFLADNLSGFFRLRFKKPASPILLYGIEMRGVD